MTSFTFMHTEYTMNPFTGRYAKKVNGKTTRIGKAEYEKARKAHDAALLKLNHEQNEKNEFTNISEEDLQAVVAEAEESETTEEIKAIQKKMTRKAKKAAKASFTSAKLPEVTLTAKQVDFIRHLPDTHFWEHGLDSTPWVDCLCEDIGGQFAGKPMTVGAMVSTLREKGLLVTGTEKVNGRKAKYFELTAAGKQIAAELGLH